MRVLILEHPRLPSREHFNDIANTPLWSCLMAGYTAAALQRAGVEAVLWDARRRSFARVAEKLLAEPPDLLLVHAVYFWEPTPALFEFLADLKARGFSAPLALLGFFPTAAWAEILAACPAVDYILAGEPEETAVDLALALARGEAPGGLGLAGRQAGEPRLPGLRPPVDPDLLAPPARPYLAQEDTVSVLASRGCYNCCSFCLIPALNGNLSPWRGRRVELIAEEVAGLAAAGKRDIYFVDPNFIGPGQRGRERTRELGRALGELGVTFGMESRAQDLRPGLMEELAAQGLTSLLLGLESGSGEVLARLGKNSSVAANLAAIELVRRAGLEPEVGFIMFERASTLGEVAANLEFLREANLLDRLGRTANLLYHHQIALKGTGLYAQALAAGKLIPEGVVGFEGRLVYEDPRVAWLAGALRSLCLEVLRHMGRAEGTLYWSRERTLAEPFRSLNQFLVETFPRWLAWAGRWDGAPPAEAGAALLAEGLAEAARLAAATPAAPAPEPLVPVADLAGGAARR
ncbi:MAG: B12-binding domain-containing radical SAM protein [Deltaproteobacteria bacterium]|nr:B12-binding domain-containing radical SAM protein [Deltaproteobacteria bacterium]